MKWLWLPFFAIALILLGVGAGTAAHSSGWRVERNSLLDINAPPAVSWTVWVPAPDAGISYAVDGLAQVKGRVETIHGTLLNVTGTGAAHIRGTDTIFTPGGDTVDAIRPLNLSGREAIQTGPVFWVWRASSEPTATLRVYGGTHLIGTRVWDYGSCGGPGFYESVDEGWTALPVLLGDCAFAIAVPPPEDFAKALLMVGATAAAVSLLLWTLESTARRQVFVRLRV